jgi:hypothetical protein
MRRNHADILRINDRAPRRPMQTRARQKRAVVSEHAQGDFRGPCSSEPWRLIQFAPWRAHLKLKALSRALKSIPLATHNTGRRPDTEDRRAGDDRSSREGLLDRDAGGTLALTDPGRSVLRATLPWSALTAPRCKCFSVLMRGNAILLSLQYHGPDWSGVAARHLLPRATCPKASLLQRLT